jgi:hypothetical protein
MYSATRGAPLRKNIARGRQDRAAARSANRWYPVVMSVSVRISIVFILFGVVLGCRRSSTERPAAVEHYTVRGKIMALSAEAAEIHHERVPAIRGYDGTIKPMASMTMSFARNQTSFAGLGVGDIVEIEFTVHFDGDPTLRLARIVKLPPETVLDLR